MLRAEHWLRVPEGPAFKTDPFYHPTGGERTTGGNQEPPLDSRLARVSEELSERGPLRRDVEGQLHHLVKRL